MSLSSTIKVGNISTNVTETVLRTLFGFLGEITDFNLYPSSSNETQECKLSFHEQEAVLIAQHLNGVELGDKHLVISSSVDRVLFKPSNVPIATSTRATSFSSAHSNKFAPNLANLTPEKVDEVSRTIYVGNVNCTVTEFDLVQFFSVCGPVSYVKIAGAPTQQVRYAFMEFATQSGAQLAMQLNGSLLEGKPLKVNRSKTSITKAKVDETDDVVLAMRRVREAQQAIAHKYRNGETTEDKEEEKGADENGTSAHSQKDRIKKESGSASSPIHERDKERERGKRRSSSRTRSRSRSPSFRKERRRSRSRSRESRRRYSPDYRRSRRRRYSSRERSPYYRSRR